MTILQAIISVIVALIAGAGGAFGFLQFMIKRKDEKEENDVQKRIDEAVLKAKTEMLDELSKVSKARSDEGAERFNTHKVAINEVIRQTEENSKQIGELTSLTKNVLQNMASLNQVVTISAESQKNNNYDRLLIVVSKILKSKRMTISDKTNLKQLYTSWKALKGEDPKMDTMYEECMKLEPILDES